MIGYSTLPRESILKWTSAQCFAFKDFGPDYRALGVLVDGELSAAVFYDDFRRGDCNMAVYIGDRRSVSRSSLRRAFQYPFMEAGQRRVTALVSSHNAASRSLIERLGFKREGVRRFVYENGADEIIYGMLRSECRWLTLRERLEDPHTAGAF